MALLMKDTALLIKYRALFMKSRWTDKDGAVFPSSSGIFAEYMALVIKYRALFIKGTFDQI